MDTSLFEKPSGVLVRTSFGEMAYTAFVPEPLPPDLPPDNELMRVCTEAAYALGELSAMGRTMPNPHLLLGPFLRREAVLSSRIEGTQTGVADLYAYEAMEPADTDGDQAADTADAREVLNYVRALEHGLARLEELSVSKRLMLEVHERLLRGVRGEAARPGEFRTVPNCIGRPGCNLADADFVPPPVAEMNDALDALEQYINTDDEAHHALIRLAYIHYQFEAIHPFLDGNGRIGRLLISLLLVYWKLLPAPLLYLSAYFEQSRDQYYDLLFAVSAKGAWREWALFFLRGVAEQSRDASSRAKQLQDLRLWWHEQLKGSRSGLTLTLADHLFMSPVITVPQAQRLLGVTYRSAKGNIEKLVDANILYPDTKSSYGRTFTAWEILRIISAQMGE